MFYVTISADFELSVEDVWPDGDAPENPTADDVAQVMRDGGSCRTVLRDWNLDDDYVVAVDGVEVW